MSKYKELYDLINNKWYIHNNIKHNRWIYQITIYNKTKELKLHYREYHISAILEEIQNLPFNFE